MTSLDIKISNRIYYLINMGGTGIESFISGSWGPNFIILRGLGALIF